MNRSNLSKNTANVKNIQYGVIIANMVARKHLKPKELMLNCTAHNGNTKIRSLGHTRVENEKKKCAPYDSAGDSFWYDVNNEAYDKSDASMAIWAG